MNKDINYIKGLVGLKNELLKDKEKLTLENKALKEQLRLHVVSGSCSVFDVRDMMTEMRNEAVTGLRGEKRWDMQKRLGEVRDKYKLDG